MAGQTIAYLEAIVGADLTSFRRGMAEVRSEIAGTAGLSSGLTSLGTALTLGLTVPILAVSAVGLKMFADFDEGMRNVNSIMQLPEDQFQKLGKAIQDFGLETRDGATAAAKALYTIVSAGFGIHDTAEAMKVLSVATFGAEAGLADVNVVAQVLSQSLLAFGQGASSAQHYMDVLTQTVNLGVGSMDDVANAFGQVISTASLMKIPFDTLGGSMAFLTQRGMDFSEAAVSINQVMTQLLKPPKALEAAFKSLGVASGSELVEKFGGLGGALQALWGYTNQSADGLAKLFTNVRAFRGAASILENFDDYTTLMNEFGSSLDGVTSRAHIQQAQSLSYWFDRMKAVLQDFFITIGRDVAPVFGKLIDGVIKLGYWFHDLDPVVVQNAVKFGLLLAAIGPILIILGALLSPIGLLTVGLALLAKAFEDNFGGIRDFITSAWNDYIKPAVDGIVKAFSGDIPGAVKDFASSKIDVDTSAGLIKFFADLGDRVRFFVDSFSTNLQTTAFAVQYWLQYIKDTFDKYFGKIFIELGQDIATGNWERFFKDLGYMAQDAGHLIHDSLVVPIEKFATNKSTNLIQYLADVKKGLDVLTTPKGGTESMNPIISFSLLFITELARIKKAWDDTGIWSYERHAFWQDPQFSTDASNTFSGIANFFDQNLVQPFKTGLDNLGQLVKNIVNAIGDLVASIVNGIITVVNAAITSINQLAAIGASFTGSSTGSISLIPLIGQVPPNPFIGTPGSANSSPGTTTPFPTTPNSGGGGFGPGQYGTFGGGNTIIIQSNDPDAILRELRRRGIDLGAPKRG